MKSIYTLVLSLVLCVVFAPPSEGKEWFSSPVEITFQVVDENGHAVKGANVEGYLWSPYTHDAVGDTFNLRTDEEGKCIIHGKGYSSLAGVVQADDYYRTEFNIPLGDKNVARETGHWSLQETTVTLKGVRNPVPMYANRVDIEIPEQGQSIGFDLKKGDWVAPHGQGAVSDFLINVSGVYEEMLNRHSFMTISFENLEDGIQGIIFPDDGSSFRSVYEAPSTGYATNYVYEKKISHVGSERINARTREDKYYVFRVRTQTDPDGKIVSANYGKIYGDILCDFIDDEKIGVYFTYYFNPTPNDRNLEFDMSRNLLPGGRVNKP